MNTDMLRESPRIISRNLVSIKEQLNTTQKMFFILKYNMLLILIMIAVLLIVLKLYDNLDPYSSNMYPFIDD